ncbi:MAG: UDP-N-acetylglucosamine 2-epimerase (hydrolyzing) [Bdellovibrionales bacterium]|nr:UDP-N-acetylglucosamine 2-epimerase (hydrolyzing) [Bdellovibrionales bacterium]
MKRRIAVVTGSRAEYGLLRFLMKAIQGSDDLELQTACCGMHLSTEFGETWREIEADGFQIHERIEMLVDGDSLAAMSKSTGIGVIGFTEALERLAPDIVVVLGDRYEILSAAVAAMLLRIPIAHIHGGETTEGAIDESIRHAITKMSAIHFVSAEPHLKRVIQLGENPSLVFNVGAPGLDGMATLTPLTRAELERQLNVQFGPKNLLITFHPETLSSLTPEVQIRELIAALECLHTDTHLFFTKPNADAGGRRIAASIEAFARDNPTRTRVFTSLGQLRYLSLMKQVDAVVGNSSSGLIEAPFFQKPTVNIGDRQKGRLHGESVLNCEIEQRQILQALALATDTTFLKQLMPIQSPYGTPGAANRMLRILQTASLEALRQKPFFDLDASP